tara:strand:+ start:161 stop:349 length:189 start_codon:yes stop_codon:yes gene_type:complete
MKVKIKRTKQNLIDCIVIVVGSLTTTVNEKLLATQNNDKLIKILQDATGKSYNEIKYYYSSK